MTQPETRADERTQLQAAGTLALALSATLAAAPAHADVMITPINVLLGSYSLDVDGDGTPEYTFNRTDAYVDFGTEQQPFLLHTYQNDLNPQINSVVGYDVNDPSPKPGTYASALASGELIDASRNFVSSPVTILSGKELETYGEFFAPHAFIGLQFQIGDGTTHFGWVETRANDADLTLVRFGWETDADKGIVTPSVLPEPGSLALLVAGAAGVAALRRRQRGNA